MLAATYLGPKNSVEVPLCQFLGDESMKSRETAFMLGMIIEGKGFHD